MNNKPRVMKMAGIWLWTCEHDGRVGDEYRSSEYRDAWTAALSGAVRHTALFHNTTEGEEVQWL